jgi:hypothetical protein
MIESVSVDSPATGPSIDGAADVMLLIATTPSTTVEVTGVFDVFARVSLGFVGDDGSEGDGRVSFRLGAQLGDDRITMSEVAQAAGQALRLGCFDVDLSLSRLEPDQIAPLGAVNLAGEVYTINDYGQMPSLIVFDENGVPSSGELTALQRGSERCG